MAWTPRRRRSYGQGGLQDVYVPPPDGTASARCVWRFTCDAIPYPRYVSNYEFESSIFGSAFASCSYGFSSDIVGTAVASCSYSPWVVTTGAVNQPWTPDLESDLILWLDPTDVVSITKDGSDRVSVIDDKSVSGWDHAQATGTAQGLYGATSLGGDPGIYFNGSLTENERMTNAAVSITSSTLTWGIVCKLDATQLRTSGRIACFKTNDRAQEWDSPLSLITLRYEAAPSPRVIMERGGSYLEFGAADTDAHIYVAVMDGTKIRGYRDGVYVGELNFTGALSSEHSAYGGSYSTGFNAAATLGEYVVFSGAASDTKRQVIEGYLRAGAPTATSLVAGHPFESSAPTSSGGGVVTPPPPPAAATDVVVRARQDAVAGANAQFRFVVNGVDISTVHEVTATSSFEDISFGIDTAVAGITKFGIRFINDSYSAGPPVLDRNLYIDRVSLASVAYLSTIAVQYDATTGQTITGANAGSMYNNGLLEWTIGGTTTPPPPTTGTPYVLSRSSNFLTWNGAVTKLWGVNFRPWQVFDVDGPPTWTDAKRDRSYDEIARIKTSFGGNYVRVNIAPGEYVYWSDPARNRFWTFLDGLLDRALTEGMFIELNWWTVSTPDGQRADDSFFSSEYAPGYNSSKALCRTFWAAAAARYKNRGYVAFSLWDEPIKAVPSDTWAQLQPWVQELITLIRGTGATNLISVPGNHYSMMFQEILTTHQLVDPLENWAMRWHAFLGAGEPQNYDAFTTSGGTRLDTVRPLIIGGAGHEPVTLLEPPAGVYKTWLDTVVYPRADGLAWWDGSAYNTPNLYQTGYPTNAATTYTNYGLYAKNNPISPLLRPTAETTTPPPPPPPPAPGTNDAGLPTIPVFAPIVDLTGQANIYVDTVAGNDGNAGTSVNAPKRTVSAGWAALSNNQKLAIKCGSVTNGFTNLSGKTGVTIGAYGTGNRPVFKNVREFTGSQIQNRGNGKYTVSLGGLPQSTAYAAGRVTHATTVYINDGAHVCTWYARNGEAEVLGTSRTDMLWHTNGNCTFCSPVTPTKVEIGYEDCFLISGNTGGTIQDCQFGPSRGHGCIISNAENYTVQRNDVIGCGVSGFYIQSRSGTTTSGVIVQGNRTRYCHAEGIVMSWPGNVRNAFRTTKVRDNIIQNCCKGPPFIFSGFTSQDYYSAGIKFFTNTWESPTWDNDIEVSGNLIEDMGDANVRYVYSGNYRYDGVNGYESNQAMGIWVDTVTGGTAGVVKIHRNTIRRTWAAGVMLEANPNAPHQVYNNVIENCGLQLTGYSGGICSCRGNSGSLIYHNTLRNNSYAGMNMQAGGGNTVTGDGRTIIENTSNVTWRDNIVIAAPGVPVVREIYRSGTTNGTVYNNNLFFGSNIWQYRSNNNPWDNPTSYNSVAAWTTARGGSVSNSRTGDPLLDSQYRPRAGSDAIGRASDGKNIGAAETTVA